MAQVQRLAPDDAAVATVALGAPLERVEAAGNHRDTLANRQHRGAWVRLTRIAELLAGALHEDADDVAVAEQPAREPDRVAITLAAPHDERPRMAQEIADQRHAEQLELAHVVDRALRVDRHEGRVDRPEMVGGDHEPALRRHAIVAVADARRDHPHAAVDVGPRDLPVALRVVVPQLRDAEVFQDRAVLVGHGSGF